MKNMNPSEIPVLDLIPQRPPMQMIDRLIYADENSAQGTLLINPANLFVENNFLSESALVEFIAQTAAAFTGFNSIMKNSAVGEGYIGAVKNLVVYELPPVNTVILSKITVVNEIVGFTIILGKVFLENRMIAECEMRILSKN